MFQNRLKKVSSLLPSYGCEALLVEDPTNIYYLTGIELSTGKLVILANSSMLLVDGRYYEMCKKKCPCPVHLIDKHPLKEVITSHSIKTLGFETDKTSYKNFLSLQENPCTMVPVDAPIQTIRIIKDRSEIEILAEAAKLGYSGYEFVESLLKEGITESDLAFELEFFWKNKGAKKLAFDPIIAFGPNSSMPHYRAGSTKLKKGMPVLIDIGVTWEHYQSDMTRVVFFGDPHPKIKEIYGIVEEAKKKAMDLCKPGVLIQDVDRAARGHIESKGYGEFFTHTLGHGVGLDIHEPPRLRSNGLYSDLALEAGMVITIEPGIYLPDIGGVRLEDTIVITPRGYENLTAN